MILLRGALPLMLILELWALVWWHTKIHWKHLDAQHALHWLFWKDVSIKIVTATLIMRDVCPPCRDDALGISAQGGTSWLQFYCRKPGNAIKSWDRWDGKETGKWAGSQEGWVIRVDWTDLPLKGFARLAFFDGKILSMCVEEQHHFWKISTFPARLDLSPQFFCFLDWAAGQGEIFQWGSTLGSDMNFSAKGSWYPPLRLWESTPEDWGSHRISWL